MENFLLEGEHHLFTLTANYMSTLSTGCLRCRHEKHYVPVWTFVYTATSSTETYLICDDILSNRHGEAFLCYRNRSEITPLMC